MLYYHCLTLTATHAANKPRTCITHHQVHKGVKLHSPQDIGLFALSALLGLPIYITKNQPLIKAGFIMRFLVILLDNETPHTMQSAPPLQAVWAHYRVVMGATNIPVQ